MRLKQNKEIKKNYIMADNKLLEIGAITIGSGAIIGLMASRLGIMNYYRTDIDGKQNKKQGAIAITSEIFSVSLIGFGIYCTIKGLKK